MGVKRVDVASIAREAELELDEALILLWDAGFSYINGPGDKLPRGEANRARRALGLATRRELGSPEHWCERLGITRAELESLLEERSVRRPFEGSRLRKHAIRHLNAYLREQGLPATTEEPLSAASGLTSPVWQPLVWRTVGHSREVRHLTVEDVTGIHMSLVEDFASAADPISPPGIKNESLLASAVHRATTSLGGEPKYPTVEMSAAALLHGLVHNHPFHNGNKRTALVSMLVFLDENGLVLTCEEDELFKLVLQLAQHAIAQGPRHELADREVLAVAEWLHSRCRKVEKGDRPIPWRRLRRILTNFGCTLEFPGTVGNRINISRRVVRRSRWLGREKVKTLYTQSHYASEGRDVEPNAINKMRKDLELDDEHGIDSLAFYDNVPCSPSEFISRYRKTLSRLARL